MPKLIRASLIAALVAMAGGVALARDLPSAPLAPVDYSECAALAAQYQAIASDLRGKAYAIRTAALMLMGFIGQEFLEAWDQARPIDEEASRVTEASHVARKACDAQVAAHKSQERERTATRQRQETFSNTREALGGVLPGAAKEGAKLAATTAFAKAASIDAGGLTGQAIARAGQAAMKGVDLFDLYGDVSNTMGVGHDKLRGTAGLGIRAGEGVGLFSPLNALRIGTSLQGIIDINEGATRDLDRLMRDPNEVTRPTIPPLGSAKFAPLPGSAQPAVADSLAQDLAASVDQAIEARSERGTGSRVAIQQEEQERLARQEAERESAPAPTCMIYNFMEVCSVD